MKSYGLFNVREILLSLINQQTQQQEKEMKDQLEALVKQMHESGILYFEAVREFKKRFILNVLASKKGNQCRAARELGFHRNTLSRVIGELRIDVRQFKGSRRMSQAKLPATEIVKGDPHFEGIHRTIWDTDKQAHVCECGWENNSAKAAVAHEQTGTHPLQPLANSLSKMEPGRVGSALVRGSKRAAKVGA